MTVINDVRGIGPDNRGILKAGEYKSSNKFACYFIDDETVYLHEKEWIPQWNLEITHGTGWMKNAPVHFETIEVD